jgi:hypothetical protein
LEHNGGAVAFESQGCEPLVDFYRFAIPNKRDLTGKTKTKTKTKNHPIGKSLDLDDGPLGFNLLNRMELTLAAAGANLASFRPSLRGTNVRIPKWPCPTLPWASAIDLAFSSLAIKENAISIGSFFQRLPLPHAINVGSLEFLDARHSDRRCKVFDLFFVDPDISWSTGTTISALGTSELQTILIPRSVGHN